VVVNDIGVQLDGSGGSAGPAQQTANEIREAGGIACANTDSVAQWASAQKIVQQALDFARQDRRRGEHGRPISVMSSFTR